VDVTTGQLRQTLSRNDSTIAHAVAFTPDGGQIAVAAHVSGHDEVQFWTAATGAAGRTLVAGAEHEIGQLVFAPDGETLAVVGQLGETALTVFWDLATGKPGRTRPSSSVAYALDGKTVATAESGGRIMLRNPSNGEALPTLSTGEDSITEVVFAPDGRTLATAGESVRIWDYPRLTQLVKVPVRGGSVVGIAFSPDGATLVSKGDTTLRIWDVSTGHLTRTIPGFWDWSSRVEYAANGKMVAALVKSGPSKAEVFSLGMVDTVVNTASAPIAAGASDAAALRTWGGAAFPVLDFALRPDSRSAAVGTASPSSIEIRDLASGQVSATFVCTQQEDGVEDGCAPTFSRNGATLAGGPNDEKGTVQIWNVASHKLVRTLVVGARVNQVAFTADGRSVAIASEDRAVQIWDVATGTAKTLIGHADAVYSVAFSPDGTTVATGGVDRGVLIWNVATSKLLHTFTGHAGSVNAVAFAPNGRTVASASDDGTIRLWPR
jgi:WD40 repeat protein